MVYEFKSPKVFEIITYASHYHAHHYRYNYRFLIFFVVYFSRDVFRSSHQRSSRTERPIQQMFLSLAKGQEDLKTLIQKEKEKKKKKKKKKKKVVLLNMGKRFGDR